jgi:hypothetical protein
LRIRTAEELRAHASRGAIFETFVISELYKNFAHRGDEPDLYFWRDSPGHEIDVVVERGADLVPIEIKSARTLASDFFSGIDYWRRLSGSPEGPAALVYGGERSLRRKSTVVYSWSSL